MSSGMWAKALETADDARLLFCNGRYNGAVSRSYYAMLCAARAALQHIHPDADQARTHTGVIRQFGLEVAGRDGVDPKLGRMLSRMEDVRLEADYDEIAIDEQASRQVLEPMNDFLLAIAAFLKRPLTP